MTAFYSGLVTEIVLSWGNGDPCKGPLVHIPLGYGVEAPLHSSTAHLARFSCTVSQSPFLTVANSSCRQHEPAGPTPKTVSTFTWSAMPGWMVRG